MRISERDLVIPALFVISRNPRIATGELIKRLEDIFQPQGEDAEILSGRSDTKFSQMVRNLVSHNTLTDRYGYVEYHRGEERRSGGEFTITDEGQKYLNENIDEIDGLLTNGFQYEDLVSALQIINEDLEKPRRTSSYIDETVVIREGERKTYSTTSYERSSLVRYAAIDYYRQDNNRIVCIVCSFDFFETYGEIGRDFIEIHHEKPLFQEDGVARDVFLKDAVKSVKPLCSNCHRMIHRKRTNILTVDELREIINRD